MEEDCMRSWCLANILNNTRGCCNCFASLPASWQSLSTKSSVNSSGLSLFGFREAIESSSLSLPEGRGAVEWEVTGTIDGRALVSRCAIGTLTFTKWFSPSKPVDFIAILRGDAVAGADFINDLIAAILDRDVVAGPTAV